VRNTPSDRSREAALSARNFLGISAISHDLGERERRAEASRLGRMATLTVMKMRSNVTIYANF
jgi:hypothetical protein